MKARVLHNPLNGRFTVAGLAPSHDDADTGCRCVAEDGTGDSYEDAEPQEYANYWTSTENNINNAWNVNFGTGNVNNNNKYNGRTVRAVAAYGGLPELFMESVVEAYHDCLRDKMSSKQALEYMETAGDDLPRLAWELWTCTYRPSTSTCFLVKYPKLREVFAANFRDRIVHHWICMRLEPLFEERFVSHGNVSFNCRRGFGTDRCVNTLAEGMRRVTGSYQQEAWVFRGDLVGFFMSIDKALLWRLIERFMHRWRKRMERTDDGRAQWMFWEQLLYAVRTTVMHRPEQDCVLNTDASEWLGLDRNKSLFGCGSRKGEPIGNLTTQLFANFLLSFLDMYVLFLFRRKNYEYVRFVDDFSICCDDLVFLKEAVAKMERFLSGSLRLTMHKDKRYMQPASHGMLMVGSVVKYGRTYLSGRTVARMMERAVGFARQIDGDRELNAMDCQRIEQVINSYLGFCRGRRTYRIRRKVLGMMGRQFFKYFYIKGHYDSIRTRPKYRPMAVI